MNKEIGVEDIMLRIKSDDNWFANVKKKALEKEITLDSMLFLDANYIINQGRINVK